MEEGYCSAVVAEEQTTQNAKPSCFDRRTRFLVATIVVVMLVVVQTSSDDEPPAASVATSTGGGTELGSLDCSGSVAQAVAAECSAESTGAGTWCPVNSVPVVTQELCRPDGSRCPILLDVRTEEEWNGPEGHASCAARLQVQLDPTLTETVLAMAAGDTSSPIVTYCYSGVRAGTAETILAEAGFTAVTNGGGWIEPEGNAARLQELCTCNTPCSAAISAEIIHSRRSVTPTTLPFDPTIVSTPSGLVRGVLSTDTGTREFYGIPYGAPPVNNRRFMPPTPVERWSGVKDATTQRDGCMRSGRHGTSGSEDCLYVNVHAPLPSKPCHKAGGLPVMEPSGSPEPYDGSALVEDSGGDVIVVTVAFRLGVFGHLASNGLKARSMVGPRGNKPGSAGNWGIQDQRESLRWVKRNIAAFGGNPDNILIFGESSGGSSVSSHMLMAESWPFFDKAIIESGSFPSWGTHSWEAAETNYRKVTEAIQCDATSGFSTDEQQIACLVSADALHLAAAGSTVGLPCRDGCSFAPVVDGVELPDWPFAMIQSGQRAMDKPLIQLHCNDDGAGFTYMESTGPSLNIDGADPPPPPPRNGRPAPPPSSVSPHDLEVYWSHQYGDNALQSLRAIYPLESFEAEAAESQRIGYGSSAGKLAGYRSETDFAYACSARWASEYFSTVSPVWEMQFNFGYNRWEETEDATAHVTHGAELAFVFSHPTQADSGMPVADMPEPVRVADMIVSYFTNFAHSGNPNGVSDLGQTLPVWPQTRGSDPTRPAEDLVLQINGADEGDVTVLNEYQGEACQFWRDHWQPWDRETCFDGCFGGCIPCDFDGDGELGPRLDPSQYGEPTGYSC